MNPEFDSLPPITRAHLDEAFEDEEYWGREGKRMVREAFVEPIPAADPNDPPLNRFGYNNFN